MEGVVEPETRDSSDSTIVNTISNSDVSSVVPPGSSGEVNNNDLLGLSDESMAAEHTVVKETFSDENFDPDLPTGYSESSQASPAKDKVAEKDMDEGNSEKIVPALEKEDSMKSTEASKLTATSEVNTFLNKMGKFYNLSEMTQYSRNLVSNTC